MRHQSLLLCVVWMVTFLTGMSESATLSTRLDTDSLTLGDRIHLQVRVTADSACAIAAPDADTAFGERVECLQWHRQRLGDTAELFSYVLTTWTPKQCTIPRLTWLVACDSMNADSLQSAPIPLRFYSVITTDSATLRDIKPLFAAGERSWWWVWLLAALAAVVVGALVLLRWYGRRHAGRVEPPPVPPYDEAIEALAALDRDNLLQKGMIQHFVFRVSAILRRYISRVYDVAAQEYTTEEMQQWLQNAPVSAQARERLAWFFNEIAPVKYARFIPSTETLTRCMDVAWWFVDHTRPSNRVQSESQEETIRQEPSSETND